jgi:hypothetical protein
MNENAETPRAESGAFQEDSAAGGRRAVTVAHATVSEQGALFPAGKNTPVVRPIPLTTRGRTEFTAKCPCGSWHRHITLGVVHGPCGTAYRLQTRRGRVA